ncbi:transcriptional repressor AgaR [Endozoicomonas elysicola]|uniref:Transcriptional regulator n=1 Tax=Endozoicomonas elysicola TaxID=305900 RepID=A0A081KGS8_9GAMM|nr:transcriptional repressor AgaR [Endozoicomonas elysicola]KEI73354.1 transcriptional regulator [Endozoicomonas elysicola]
MSTVERREAIVRLVRDKGLARVEELAEHFKVSSVTIRNDLNYLDNKGLLLRSHGGAMALDDVVKEMPFDDKGSVNISQKEAIGAAAARLVNDGESIILDSGTTTQQLAKHLVNNKNLVVMTNGLNVASELVKASGIEIMMTGGTLRSKSHSFYGSQAEDALRQYRFDKLFLGVDGFDLVAGLTTHFDREATLNRVMCDISSEIILLADSSKFGSKGYHFIRSFGAFHTLVTDKGIPADYMAGLQRQGVRVIIADS